MKYVVFSVYDKVSKIYSNPSLAINTQDALRSYDNFVSRAEVKKDDFVLTWLGVWDNVKGLFYTFDKKQKIQSLSLLNDSDIENVEGVVYE